MTAHVKMEPAACNVEDSDFSNTVLTSSPKRARLPENLNEMDKEELINLWNDQEQYVDHLENLLQEDIKLVLL